MPAPPAVPKQSGALAERSGFPREARNGSAKLVAPLSSDRRCCRA